MIGAQGRVIPVILSGGTGSRLWPLSREACPKQLLSLLDEKTLLQQTALRIADPSLFANPMVIANAEHRFAIGEQLCGVGISDPTIVLEPFGRDRAGGGGRGPSGQRSGSRGHHSGGAGGRCPSTPLRCSRGPISVRMTSFACRISITGPDCYFWRVVGRCLRNRLGKSSMIFDGSRPAMESLPE